MENGRYVVYDEGGMEKRRGRVGREGLGRNMYMSACVFAIVGVSGWKRREGRGKGRGGDRGGGGGERWGEGGEGGEEKGQEGESRSFDEGRTEKNYIRGGKDRRGEEKGNRGMWEMA